MKRTVTGIACLIHHVNKLLAGTIHHQIPDIPLISFLAFGHRSVLRASDFSQWITDLECCMVKEPKTSGLFQAVYIMDQQGAATDEGAHAD